MATAQRLRTTGLGLLAGAALLLTACGGNETQAVSEDEVASLDDPAAEDSAASAEDGGDATQADVEAAALEFSACLRDQGLDVPDIGVDADGNLQVREALQEVAPQDGSLREVMDECSELLDGVGFGGGRRAAIADNPEIADAFLEFSDCVRGEGFEDVPDLTIPTPGEGGAPAEGQGDGPPARGEGDREGGFGNRTARLAEQLGLDADDPEVQAALETCAPVIDQAFADAGVGQGGGGGR